MAHSVDKILLVEPGDLITMDDDVTMATAVAVKDDVIVTVGREELVMKLKHENTQVVDMKGRCIVPGLIEPHTHPILVAELSNHVDINGFESMSSEDVYRLLKERAAKTPKGDWVIAQGFNPMLVHNIDVPSRQSLDAVSTQHPIIVMAQNLHVVYVNSLALDISGITDETPNPPGGEIVKDSDGHLTGQLREGAAFVAVFQHVPQLDSTITREVIAKTIELYAKQGYVTISPIGMFTMNALAEPFKVFEDLVKISDCPIRVISYVGHASPYTEPRTSRDENFHCLGRKFFADGSPYVGTMATGEPYLDTELTRNGLGFATYPSFGLLIENHKSQYEKMFPFHKAGRQLATHAHGERAISQTLDVYEALLKEYPREDHRYRLEHCGLITEDQLLRAKKLGVTVSLFINHIYYYGKFLQNDILGKERAERFMPVQSAEKLGHRWSLHADSPCSPPGPMRMLQTAVTRRTRNNEQIGTQQTVSVDQALAAMTTNAAWQLFQEDRLGKIKVGYKADFTILDKNPRKVDPDQIEHIKINGTFKDGQQVALRGCT